MSSRSTANGANGRLSAAAAEWLARITDPDATEQDFRGWQEWLAQDAAHAIAYEEMERIWALAAHLPAAPDSVIARELAAADISEVPEASEAQAIAAPRQSVWQRLTVASAAAAAAILIVVSLSVWRDDGADVIETRTAEQRSLRLTDGSQVVLGAETRVEIDMNDTRRSLAMNHGVAYFKVAHDTSRPFVVSGGGYAIEAVGTAFTVDTKPDRVSVTVTEGTVRVMRKTTRGGAPLEPLLIHAGGRVLLGGAYPRCMTVDDATDALGWRDGRLEYIQEELRFVIADVNRYTNRKIVFADPEIGRLEFTGTLFLEHIDEWLSTLQGSFPLTVVPQDNQQIVLRATGQQALSQALSTREEQIAGPGC